MTQPRIRLDLWACTVAFLLVAAIIAMEHC